MNKKVIIVDWINDNVSGSVISGERYTLLFSDSSSRIDCGQAIDAIGDPSEVKWKIFDFDEIADGIDGIETQKDLERLYNAVDGCVKKRKEHSF